MRVDDLRTPDAPAADAAETAAAAVAPAGRSDDIAASAGRGTIFITASKLWFMVTGAALMFVLPRLLTQEQIGIYKVVIGLVSILNAVVVTGTIQTVSKFVSQTPDRASAIQRRALLLQCLLGGGAAAGFALAAPLTARALGDDHLTPFLRLAALITISYAFYAVFVGVLNGRKEFFKQASLDAVYSTVKLVMIVLLTVATGYTLAGAISGFAAAAFVVLVAAALLVGIGGRGEESPVGFGNLLQFQLALIAFLFVNNMLMKTDLFFVKALISTDPAEANAAAGAYGAALDFAYIVFQIIIAITFVIFPLVSEATFNRDLGVVRGYVRQTIRATFIISALPAVLFSANALEVLTLVYPPEYGVGAPALRIVAVGMLSFAVITVLTSVISSGGRPWVSVAIVAVTLALDAGLNALLIPALGLRGAAFATTIAMAAGAAGCIGYVISRYGAFADPLTLVRVALAGAIVYALSALFPSDAAVARMGAGALLAKVAVVGEFVLFGVVYLILLVVLREIGSSEVQLARRVLGIR